MDAAASGSSHARRDTVARSHSDAAGSSPSDADPGHSPADAGSFPDDDGGAASEAFADFLSEPPSDAPTCRRDGIPRPDRCGHSDEAGRAAGGSDGAALRGRRAPRRVGLPG